MHFAETNTNETLKTFPETSSLKYQEDQPSLNLIWIADNNYNIFENKTNNKWVEKLNGKNTFEFEQVDLNKGQKNGILLYDSNRKVYVELNEFNSNYGDDETELRPLYNGRWLNEDFADKLKLNLNQNSTDNNNSQENDKLTQNEVNSCENNDALISEEITHGNKLN